MLRRFRLTRWIAGCVLVSTLLCHAALANTLTPAVYSSLEKAQTLLADQQHTEALAQLERLLNRTREGSLDRAMTWQLIGHCHSDIEQDEQAINAYQQALAQNSLPPQLQRSVVGNLAQLHIRQQQYQRGLNLLEQWLAEQEASADDKAAASPELYMLAAHAAVQLDAFPRALGHAETAFRRHKNPPENWYQMLIGLYAHEGQRNKARPLLHQVIREYQPRKRYWRQLTALHLADEQMDKALQNWQLAAQQDLLDSAQDWYLLANLYAANGLPFQAGEALEQGQQAGQVEKDLRYWRQLSIYWQAARERERAIEALGAVATASGEAKDYLRLVQVLMAEQRWDAAGERLQEAVRQAEEADLDELQYWLGMVYYEAGAVEKARAAFAAVSANSAFRERAEKWQGFLAGLAAQ